MISSYRVEAGEHGMSLLAFLQQKSPEGTSLKKIRQLLQDRGCKVGGKIELFSSRKLLEGEVVEMIWQEGGALPASLPILFEDEDFLFVDKPPGLVSSLEEIAPYFPSLKIRLVHRLDKDTSGVLLLAKHEKAEERAKELFLSRNVHKEYLALVQGKASSPEGLIVNYLGKKGEYAGQTLYGEVAHEQGRQAVTKWRRLSANSEASLLLCEPKTGRTHQIRVHVSEMGHPLIGDPQYAKGKSVCSYRPKRHLLHAWKITFFDPKKQRTVKVTAAVPSDFMQGLKALHLSLPT